MKIILFVLSDPRENVSLSCKREAKFSKELFLQELNENASRFTIAGSITITEATMTIDMLVIISSGFKSYCTSITRP
jgi:hypothetical protein